MQDNLTLTNIYFLFGFYIHKIIRRIYENNMGFKIKKGRLTYSKLKPIRKRVLLNGNRNVFKELGIKHIM